jgi:hypothetical protein
MNRTLHPNERRYAHTVQECHDVMRRLKCGQERELQLDKLCRHHTGFRSFRDLITAPGYRPSCRMDNAAHRQIAVAYDEQMQFLGDERRAFRSGEPLPLENSQRGRLFLNQGWRDTVVLAVTDDRALLVYGMPNGREFLLDVPRNFPLSHITEWDEPGARGTVRNIAQKTAPKRWRAAVDAYFQGA